MKPEVASWAGFHKIPGPASHLSYHDYNTEGLLILPSSVQDTTWLNENCAEIVAFNCFAKALLKNQIQALSSQAPTLLSFKRKTLSHPFTSNRKRQPLEIPNSPKSIPNPWVQKSDRTRLEPHAQIRGLAQPAVWQAFGKESEPFTT